jgi:ribosomal protein L37AE/L43A
MTDTTIPEIKWPGYVPPPEREGMRLARIEIRVPKKLDLWFASTSWYEAPSDLGCVAPVAIYEPAPILCPECGAEMVSNCNANIWWLECSQGEAHFVTPAKPTESEALAAAECLCGLWEKKQGKIIDKKVEILS